MTITPKEYKGQALETALSFAITSIDPSMVVDAGSSLPVGTTYPFVLELERGTANFEKVLCQPRSGNNITILTRGYDGTTGVAHDPGSTVHHVLDAQSLIDIWLHITDTTRNDHTQYLSRVADKGSSSDLASIGTTAAMGSSGKWMDAGTTLVIGSGAINNSNMFGTGVVTSGAIADATITGADIHATTITAANIQAATITSTELASNAVTTAKVTDANITQAKLDATLTKEISQIIATTASYSGTPSEGAEAYETTNHKKLQYSGATDLWTPFWNYPWGYIDSHSLSTAFTTSSTHTTYQDEGLTKSITTLANRRIKVTASLNLYASGGANSIAIQMLHGATVIRQFDIDTSAISTSNPLSLTFVGFYISSAATENIKIQIKALVGNTAVDSFGSATYARELLIEDIGQGGAPA